MVITFIHDHMFVRSNNGDYFSDGKLTAKSWDRYLDFCDRLVVVGRVRDGDDDLTKKMDLSSRENVVFSPLRGNSQFFIFFRYFFYNLCVLNKAISKSDLVVLRVPSFVSIMAFVVIFADIVTGKQIGRAHV